MARELTNSITHLVKIVADECIDERIKEIRESMPPVINRYNIDAGRYFENIQQNLGKAGDKWTDTEDHLLKLEINLAIKSIAENHKRSYGAITSRIKQKELI